MIFTAVLAFCADRMSMKATYAVSPPSPLRLDRNRTLSILPYLERKLYKYNRLSQNEADIINNTLIFKILKQHTFYPLQDFWLLPCREH